MPQGVEVRVLSWAPETFKASNESWVFFYTPPFLVLLFRPLTGVRGSLLHFLLATLKRESESTYCLSEMNEVNS